MYKGELRVPSASEVDGSCSEAASSFDVRCVAVKRLEHLPESEGSINTFAREIVLMSRLHHPNLLELIGVCIGESTFSMVTEYVPRGSMYSWLRRTCQGRPPPLQLSLRFLTQARGCGEWR